MEEDGEGVLIKDSEQDQPPIHYEDIESILQDLEGYEEGRYGAFEVGSGDLFIYCRESNEENKEWIQGDMHYDLENVR